MFGELDVPHTLTPQGQKLLYSSTFQTLPYVFLHLVVQL